MLLIISFHYVYKSGYKFENLSYNSFVVKTFYMFGELGVNIFFLITGYFMVKGKFKVKKLICLLLEELFYCLISIIIATKLGVYSFEGKTFKNYFLLFFPLITNQYWFFTTYVILYIFTPYLNILINNMEKNQYKKMIIVMLLVWCIIPTLFGVFFNTTETLLYYSRFIWAIIIYFVGAYIRLYDIKIFNKISKSIIYALSSFALMLIGILVIYKFRDMFKNIGTTEVAYFWPPNTILMFILSVSIFEIFIKIKMNNIKLINILASTTLGIYLLHDGILYRYIWDKIFMSAKYLNGTYPILHILIASIIIFTVGVIIDLIRQFIEKITINKLLDSKLYIKISNKLSNINSKMLDKF